MGPTLYIKKKRVRFRGHTARVEVKKIALKK
jgi:hypothetical protein